MSVLVALLSPPVPVLSVCDVHICSSAMWRSMSSLQTAAPMGSALITLRSKRPLPYNHKSQNSIMAGQELHDTYTVLHF